MPLGTSFQYLIDEAKGFSEDPDRVLTGGPMMGMVGGDVGLTLRAVEDECVHLADARADLHMGGEARAAHTGNAGLTFYGGVHPNDRKGATRDQAVKPLSAPPKQVVIAMSMHISSGVRLE